MITALVRSALAVRIDSVPCERAPLPVVGGGAGGCRREDSHGRVRCDCRATDGPGACGLVDILAWRTARWMTVSFMRSVRIVRIASAQSLPVSLSPGAVDDVFEGDAPGSARILAERGIEKPGTVCDRGTVAVPVSRMARPALAASVPSGTAGRITVAWCLVGERLCR